MDLPGLLLDSRGFPGLIFMDFRCFCRCLWMFVDVLGCLWIFVDFRGFSLIFVDSRGCLLIFVDFRGFAAFQDPGFLVEVSCGTARTVLKCAHSIWVFPSLCF